MLYILSVNSLFTYSFFRIFLVKINKILSAKSGCNEYKYTYIYIIRNDLVFMDNRYLNEM